MTHPRAASYRPGPKFAIYAGGSTISSGLGQFGGSANNAGASWFGSRRRREHSHALAGQVRAGRAPVSAGLGHASESIARSSSSRRCA